MKTVNIGLLGLGTVGGGTLNVLVRNADEISRRTGMNIRVLCAAAKSYDPAGLDGLDSVTIHDDAGKVLTDPDVDIVVELIGGYSPAREFVLEAIANGKHVVTANKALIAMHGEEIFAAARAKGVTVAFEAAVAGGAIGMFVWYGFFIVIGELYFNMWQTELGLGSVGGAFRYGTVCAALTLFIALLEE